MSYPSRRRPSAGPLVLEDLEARTTPATLTVTNASDSGTGSLRYEISQANNGDTIVFAASLSGATIDLLTVGDTTLGPTALFVPTSITIQGSGQTITRPPSASDFRLFAVGTTGTLTLENLTLSGGLAQGGAGGGGGGAAGQGGAIDNQGALKIINSTLTGNEAIGGANSGGGAGGAGMGGAVFNQGGTVTIYNSTLAANTAEGGGATGSGATAGSGFGGAMFNLNGTVTLVNDTIAGNTVSPGAGSSGGTNGSADGGALYNLAITVLNSTTTTATVTVANTILANSSGGSDLVNDQGKGGMATITATGPNIVSVPVVNTGGTLAGTVFTVTNPLLGSLANNGGQTETMALDTGSPAIDDGNNAQTAGQPYDQRGPGYDRIYNGTVDLGAYESQLTPVVPVPPSPSVPPVPPVSQLPPLVVSGAKNGTALVYIPEANGHYSSTPTFTLQPFGPIATDVRTAVADVNGDGVPDLIFVTGPGVPFQLKVVSGVDYTTVLVATILPFGDFIGGGFVAAGEFTPPPGDPNPTTHADIVVTPDVGGGPRVSIYQFPSPPAPPSMPNTPPALASFFAFNNTSFRGGARAAVGDINGDGVPDLVVAAGFGGGPEVAVYDGKSVLTNPMLLVNEFYAFSPLLQNGSYVAVGDVNGDGYGDLIFGAGPGGGPVELTISGKILLSQGGGAVAAITNPISSFFVNGTDSSRGGVRVAALNNTGGTLADVVGASGVGEPGLVRIYPTSGFSGTSEPTTHEDITPFGTTPLTDGVFVS